MKEAIISYLPSGINWSALPALDISEHVRPTESDACAYAQICYTDEALMLHLSATEQEIRQEESGLLGMPCQDSCLEFFIRPLEEDIRYINFEFSPRCCMYLGFGSGPEDLYRLTVDEEQRDALFAPVAQLRSDGWDLYFRIPYTFLQTFFPGFRATSGTAIRANFYKCGDLLEKPHYLAWNPIYRQGSCRFHTPAEFGRLVFE